MTTTTYFWDQTTDAVMEEFDGGGTVQATYTRRPELYGPLISQYRGSSTSYYHFDALGSTRALTNDTQAVTDSYTYDVWGVAVASSGSTENSQRWVGRMGYAQSTTLNLLCVRTRSYSTIAARWMSHDPIWFSTETNPYAYAQFNPATVIDPSGEKIAIPNPLPTPKDNPSCKANCDAIFATQGLIISGYLVTCLLHCPHLCLPFAPIPPLYNACLITCVSECMITSAALLYWAYVVRERCYKDCDKQFPPPPPPITCPDRLRAAILVDVTR